MQTFQFGKHILPSNLIFYSTKLTRAFLCPTSLLQNHIILSPINFATAVTSMPRSDLIDLYSTLHTILKRLDSKFDGFTCSIQGGSSAGQVISGVHLHVVGRLKGDYSDNDVVYLDLNKFEKEFDGITGHAQVEEYRSLFTIDRLQ